MGLETYLGTRTTYSVTFWLPGPCRERNRDGEWGTEEAVGAPGPRLILTRAAMGKGRWFGFGPIRVLFASPAVRDPQTEEKPPSRCRVFGPD